MKKIFAILFLSMIVVPGVVSAADTILNPYWGPIVSCVGGAPSNGLPTCTSLCDVFATIQNALRLGVTIALYIVAPAYAVYAGFKIATSGISGDKISVARKMLVEVSIGILIIIGSFTILNTFMNALAGMLGSKGETSSWLKIACVRQGTQEESAGGDPCPGSKGCPECSQSNPPAYCK